MINNCSVGKCWYIMICLECTLTSHPNSVNNIHSFFFLLLPHFSKVNYYYFDYYCKYVNLAEEITKGLTAFKQEVETRQFPAPVHTFSMKPEEFEKATDLILHSLPEQEGDVANSLLQMKASVAEMREENSKKANVEISKPVEKATSQSENSKTDETTKKTEVVSQTTTESSTYNKNANVVMARKAWVSNFVTNFDVYYNSYFHQNEEEEKEREKEKHGTSFGKRKMKV